MSIFSRISKKQIQKETPLAENPKEMEEDGFLVIGETEAEKKALTPDKRNPNSDLPPNYEMSQSQYRTRQVPSIPQNSRQTPTEQTQRRTTDTRSPHRATRSPLFDVPFKLDDSVACALSYGHLNIDIGDELSWSTSQYDYDFTMERSVMQQSDV